MFHNYICNIISSINKSEWSEFNKKKHLKWSCIFHFDFESIRNVYFNFFALAVDFMFTLQKNAICSEQV